MKKEPKIYPLKELPQFVQMGISDMWEKLGLKPEDIQSQRDIVVTYFDGIYTARPLRKDVFVHESVHFIRQGAGENELQAKDWCLRYWTDPAFRYEEEIIAYREQFRVFQGFAGKNRQVLFEEAKRLATELSGPMYGHMVSFHSALSAIMKK